MEDRMYVKRPVSQQTVSETLQHTYESGITLRANGAHKNDDGTYTITFTARSLTSVETKMLDSLFPDTRTLVERVLQTQALISIVVER